MRQWHYLHAPRAVSWPKASIALSVVCSAGRVSSNQQQIRRASLLGWGAVYWRGREGRAEETASADGVTRESFWQWLSTVLRKKEAVWIWQLGACYGCTQLGLFDLLTERLWVFCGQDSRSGGVGEVQRRNGQSGICVISDPPTIIACRPRYGAGSVVWLDAGNIGRLDWQGIGADVGGQPDNDDSDAARGITGRELAARRSRQLSQWLDGWYRTVRELNLGGLRMTASSQAWAGWRTSYLTCPVEVHTDAGRLSAERAAIYGGRNEAYRIGVAANQVCEVDATAHYPSIATAYPLPGRIAHSEGHTRHSLNAAIEHGLLAIARGRVYSCTGQLPVRWCATHRRADCQYGVKPGSTGYCADCCTIFPHGAWQGTYCWPEIALLERCGGQFHVEQWWGYEACDPFGAFYRALWRARQVAGSAGQLARWSAIKLVMNSLIGKACARNLTWHDLPNVRHHRPWDDWHHRDEESGALVRRRSIAWRVQEEREDGFGPEAVPALAAWIYSLGRVRLWEWMSMIPSGELLYCDTDSLWTTEAGYDRLVSMGQVGDGELGRLRLVERYAWARFFGHKLYETPEGITCAGIVPRELCQGEDSYTRWVSESPGNAARGRHAPTTALMRYKVQSRIPYRGGRVGEDGVVYPLEVYDG